MNMKGFWFLFLAALLPAAPDDAPKLTLENASLQQSEDGTPVPGGFVFVPGESVHFSCQLAGYQKVEKEDKNTISLTWSIEVRDPKGTLVVVPVHNKIETPVAPEDRKWMPKARYMFLVPPFADSGIYHIRFQAKDEHSKREANVELAFTVEGVKVEPSDKLVIRNFRFLRKEDDKEPLQVAAYRPGDTLLTRFEMIGYRLGDQNAFDIDYGLAILNGQGEEVYSKLPAAEENNQSFYPRRYTPGVISLDIPKEIPHGAYTLVVTARDHQGNQTTEVRHKFSIE
jgi:hypothetical protein